MNNDILKLKFEELKPQELREIIETSGIVYLPLGTLEWHERHLPLGLDAKVSEALCLAACKMTGGCVIPPIYFGTDREYEVNGELMHGIDAKVGKKMLGSIYYLSPDFFFEFLKNITLNISKQGFKKLIIVSTHSGTAQQEVIEKLAKEKFGNLKIGFLPGRSFTGGIDHAGKLETQLAMSLDQDLVDLSALKEPFEGILGYSPFAADKKEGEKNFKLIVKQIVNIVNKK